MHVNINVNIRKTVTIRCLLKHSKELNRGAWSNRKKMENILQDWLQKRGALAASGHLVFA